MSSFRNRIVLFLVLPAFAFVAGCGSSGSPAPVPPPTGAFSNSNLNGTYVFSISGTDVNSEPFAIVGEFTANGQGGNGTGGITGGTLDINDPGFASLTPAVGPIPDSPISGQSSYSVSVDGRGTATLGTSTPFGTIKLDFVLQDSTHGLITEFDGKASGSGTLDLQASGTTPSGTYAFIFSGADDSSGDPFAAVGNFTIGSGGISGLEDFNDGGFPYPDQSLGGNVVLGPSSTPATTLVTDQFGEQIYDVYSIDASHLKFIEMDTIGTLSGDAFSQSSTTVPNGTLAFTMEGFYPKNSPVPTAIGGFMVTDNGSITDSSTEDSNQGGTVSPYPPSPTFSASYAEQGTGRYNLSNFSDTFTGGSEYVAYPSSAGLMLLEIDNNGILSGIAYPPQSASATFSSGQGYGLNLSGEVDTETGAVEVDDIAEFTASSTSCGSGSGEATGNVVDGLLDENFDPGSSGGLSSQVVCGNYTTPDANGRGQIGTTEANGTLNGGFILTYYTVDGTTFPFIESDTGQVSTGVFVEQNATATGDAIARAKSHLFVPHRLIKSRSLQKKETKKN